MKVRQQQKLLLSGLFLGNCHLTAGIRIWVVERGGLGLRDLQGAMEREKGHGLLTAETEPRAEIHPQAGLRGGGRLPLYVRWEPVGN